jgi:hypothetical protein
MSCTDLDLFTRSSDRVSSRAQKLVAAFTGSSRIGCFLLRRARQFWERWFLSRSSASICPMSRNHLAETAALVLSAASETVSSSRRG